MMSEIKDFAIKFFKNHGLTREPKSLEDIEKFFISFRDSIKEGDPEATVIAIEIYNEISRTEVSHRKASAINFEELLTTLFEGKIINNKTRQPEETSCDFGEPEINRRVARNKLEKLDAELGSLKLSVKTLVPTNSELNIGSFSAEALFRGFLPYTPNEREFLGSKPLLRQQFEKIKSSGKWKEFETRFVRMAEIIFATDWIIAIKDDRRLVVNTISGEKFRKILIDAIRNGPSEITKIFNRFEAHALRIEIEPIIKNSNVIEVDLFGKLMEPIKEIDETLRDIKYMMLDYYSGLLSKDMLLRHILIRMKNFVDKH